DGIRDGHVTGVQTCALPILAGGHEQEDLDEGLGPDAGALEEPAHRGTQARPLGLTGPLDPVTLGAKPTLEAKHLGRLARPLDALERDECSTHVENPRCCDTSL